MQQRGEPKLHSKMFLLLVRMSALALLMGGTKVVAAAAAVEGGGGGASCRQEIPAELIRDLWSRTQQLIDTLPVRSFIADQ